MNSATSRSFRTDCVGGHQNRDQLNWVPSGCGPAPAMNFELAAFPLLGIELLSQTKTKLMGEQTHKHHQTKVVFLFLWWKWDALRCTGSMITGIWFQFLVGPGELACKLNATHPLQSNGWPPTPSYIRNTPKRDHVTLRDHPSRMGVCDRFDWISYSRSWDPAIGYIMIAHFVVLKIGDHTIPKICRRNSWHIISAPMRLANVSWGGFCMATSTIFQSPEALFVQKQGLTSFVGCNYMRWMKFECTCCY